MAWKFSYVHLSLLKKVAFLKQKKKKAKSFSVKTWSRSSTILPDFVGLRFRVYNGKEFFPLSIIQEMIGYKFGEFVPTRARYQFKKKKKKK